MCSFCYEVLNCSVQYSVAFIHLSFILIQYLVDTLNIENLTEPSHAGTAVLCMLAQFGLAWFDGYLYCSEN